MDWLSRALSRAGVLPSDEAERAVRSGRVQVEGRIQRQPFSAVTPEARVLLDGRPVSLKATTLVVMLHKPKGVVSAPLDPEGLGTVFEALGAAIPPELRSFGWHAVGRLDRNTTGLLLFTNDERLVAHATSPQTHLPKRYAAKVSGKVTEEKLETLRRGLELEDGPTRSAGAESRGPDIVVLTLTEGRNHQVKRMLGAVGLPVLELHREAIGGLELDVELGKARLLSAEEISERIGYALRGGPAESP